MNSEGARRHALHCPFASLGSTELCWGAPFSGLCRALLPQPTQQRAGPAPPGALTPTPPSGSLSLSLLPSTVGLTSGTVWRWGAAVWLWRGHTASAPPGAGLSWAASRPEQGEPGGLLCCPAGAVLPVSPLPWTKWLPSPLPRTAGATLTRAACPCRALHSALTVL